MCTPRRAGSDRRPPEPTGRRAAAASPRSRRGRSLRPTSSWPGCAGTAATWCRCDGSAPWDPVALQDATDRRGADTVAEFEQLALDPPIAPARVVPRHPRHQRGKDVVDRWPSRPVRLGPLPAHEAAMPTQDGARSDQRWRRRPLGSHRMRQRTRPGPPSPHLVSGWLAGGQRPHDAARTPPPPSRRTCGPAAGPAQAPAGRSDTATAATRR